MPEATIVAIGGSGALGPEDTEPIDRYIVSLAGKAQPRVLFIGTASRDAPDYADRFAHWYGSYGCAVSRLALTERDYAPAELAALVEAHDIIYVGGGNTLFLLNLWRGTGLDALLRVAWERGTVLCGVSAGAICWYTHGLTDSVADEMLMMYGLNFVPGYLSPHYDSEPTRRPAVHALVARGIGPWLGLEDGSAAVYRGRALTEIILAHSDRHAFRVESVNGTVTETPLPARVL